MLKNSDNRDVASKQKKILENYEHDANLIINKMFAVLVRAHEKVDKGKPRSVLEKIKSDSL